MVLHGIGLESEEESRFPHAAWFVLILPSVEEAKLPLAAIEAADGRTGAIAPHRSTKYLSIAESDP